MKHISFKIWVVLGCLAVVICTQAVIILFIRPPLREEMVEQARQAAVRELYLTIDYLGQVWEPGLDRADIDALADRMGRRVDIRVTLIDPSGVVVGDSGVKADKLDQLENHGSRPEVIQAMSEGLGSSLRYSTTLFVDFLYVAAPLNLGGNQPDLIVRLAQPLSQLEIVLSRLRNMIMMSSLVGLILAVGAAYLTAGVLTRPINRLKEAALALASGDLTRRLGRYPANEIGDLGRAFDRMAANLEAEMESVGRLGHRLETVLMAMTDGLMVVDDQGAVVLANRALGDVLGVSGPIEGRRITEVIRNRNLTDAVSATIDQGDRRSIELTTLGPHARDFEVHCAALSAPDLERGAVAVFHDVTETKRLADVRRDLVINVSHELRTPVAAIRAAVETLLAGALDQPEPARRFSGTIERHCRRLQNLIDDLLQLGSLESEHLRQEPADTALSKLVHGAEAGLTELAREAGVTLTAEVPGWPAEVRVDRRQIELALIQLGHNAIKHTPSGGQVTISAEVVNREAVLSVVDNGEGISPEHLPRIFERFYRVDKDRSRDQGGTGLGLSIVKHAVQVNGGSVAVDSFPGKGSRFTITLPLADHDDRQDRGDQAPA